MSRRAALVAGSSAAVVAATAYRIGGRLPAKVRSRFVRTNHAGREVTLLEGVAYAAGAGAAAGVPGMVAAVGAGAFGALDDHAGDSVNKGLRGHLGAAARGEVTTGLVKILGIGATGVASAWREQRRQGRTGRDALGRAVLGGAVVAGTANLVNLLDLRPGRALKATALAAAPLALGGSSASRPAAAALGASAALLPADLRGEAMLGDTGANAAGAVLGSALVARFGPKGQAVLVGLLAGLTLASEKVSFTSVIESTPVLREIDQWGRSPR